MMGVMCVIIVTIIMIVIIVDILDILVLVWPVATAAAASLRRCVCAQCVKPQRRCQGVSFAPPRRRCRWLLAVSMAAAESRGVGFGRRRERETLLRAHTTYLFEFSVSGTYLYL